MASKLVTFGYWGIRGRAGAVRNMLAYCHVSYVHKIYSDADEWYRKDKYKLGFDYPNLPYLIDGDHKITETLAILHYIPLRFGKRELIGTNDDSFIKVQIAMNVIVDLKLYINMLMSTKGDFQTEKELAFSKGGVHAKLEILDRNLKGKEWLCGSLSIADFELFEFLDLIYEMDASKLERYHNLFKLRQRMLEIPEIKSHRQSKDFYKVWAPPGVTAWTNV